jgi:ribonuclease VapC
VIVDASALVAVLFQEPGYEDILRVLAEAGDLSIPAPTLAEVGIVVAARTRRDPRGLLARLLEELDLAVIAFSDDHARGAIGAYMRYGKGRHRAGLNFGDCLVYAVARTLGQPVLCTGGDFARTDLKLAAVR